MPFLSDTTIDHDMRIILYKMRFIIFINRYSWACRQQLINQSDIKMCAMPNPSSQKGNIIQNVLLGKPFTIIVLHRI